MIHFFRAIAALLVVADLSLADNWPGWRGPDGMGHSAENNAPLKWSAKENVLWRVDLPEAGNATPAVWRDRVFVPQAREKGKYRGLMCLARGGGKLLWKNEIVYDDKETTHADNYYCSASPVTDGERVIVSYGSAGMFCYDFAGKELWKKDTGKMEHIWGNASSPILYKDLAILWIGPGARQILLAVNKNTGETVWEHNEPGGKYGQNSSEWLGSWSTPIVVKVEDHEELILSVPDNLKAFDPKTGKELWSCDGFGKLAYTSPVYADGIAVAMSGYGGPALAVRAGGKGNVTKTHRLWHHPPGNPQRIGSAVIVGEHVYILNEQGIGQCFELKTGKDLWNKERVGGPSWSAMVAVAGKLYVTNRTGETFILAANPKYERIGKNSLGEPMLASLAISDGELFIRTHKALWCIGASK